MNVSFLILFSIVLNSTAQLSLKAGLMRLGSLSWKGGNLFFWGLKIFTNPFIFGGIICYVLSLIVWLWVLSKMQVSLAYPLASLGYVATAIGSYYFLGEDLSPMRMVGIGIIIIGVFILARS